MTSAVAHNKNAESNDPFFPPKPAYEKSKVGNAAGDGPAYDHGLGKVKDTAPGLARDLETIIVSLGLALLIAVETNS